MTIRQRTSNGCGCSQIKKKKIDCSISYYFKLHYSLLKSLHYDKAKVDVTPIKIWSYLEQGHLQIISIHTMYW